MIRMSELCRPYLNEERTAMGVGPIGTAFRQEHSRRNGGCKLTTYWLAVWRHDALLIQNGLFDHAQVLLILCADLYLFAVSQGPVISFSRPALRALQRTEFVDYLLE